MSWRIIPAIAALAAAIAKPFKRKPKPTLYETALIDHPSRGHAGSLHGIGKVSHRLRRARRRYILGSFTRLLAHKPMGVGTPAVAWRAVMAKYVAHWDAKSKASTTIRLGRRAQKRSVLLKRARREIAAVDVTAMRRTLATVGGAA